MRERSKLPALLTELALMLLVFALCAAVCLSLFASARKTAAESAALGRAAAVTQSAAEVFRACGGNAEQTAATLGAQPAGGDYVLTLGADWTAADGEDAVYTLTLTPADDHTARIAVASAEGELFSLETEAVAYG